MTPPQSDFGKDTPEERRDKFLKKHEDRMRKVEQSLEKVGMAKRPIDNPLPSVGVLAYGISDLLRRDSRVESVEELGAAGEGWESFDVVYRGVRFTVTVEQARVEARVEAQEARDRA